MGYSAGQSSDGLKVFYVQQFLFHSPLVGNVPYDPLYVVRFPFPSGNHPGADGAEEGRSVDPPEFGLETLDFLIVGQALHQLLSPGGINIQVLDRYILQVCFVLSAEHPDHFRIGRYYPSSAFQRSAVHGHGDVAEQVTVLVPGLLELILGPQRFGKVQGEYDHLVNSPIIIHECVEMVGDELRSSGGWIGYPEYGDEEFSTFPVDLFHITDAATQVGIPSVHPQLLAGNHLLLEVLYGFTPNGSPGGIGQQERTKPVVDRNPHRGVVDYCLQELVLFLQPPFGLLSLCEIPDGDQNGLGVTVDHGGGRQLGGQYPLLFPEPGFQYLCAPLFEAAGLEESREPDPVSLVEEPHRRQCVYLLPGKPSHVAEACVHEEYPVHGAYQDTVHGVLYNGAIALLTLRRTSLLLDDFGQVLEYHYPVLSTGDEINIGPHETLTPGHEHPESVGGGRIARSASPVVEVAGQPLLLIIRYEVLPSCLSDDLIDPDVQDVFGMGA